MFTKYSAYTKCDSVNLPIGTPKDDVPVHVHTTYLIIICTDSSRLGGKAIGSGKAGKAMALPVSH